MGGATQALKRIPRIKFPQRHPKSSSSTSGSDSTSQAEQATRKEIYVMSNRSSEVPRPPQNISEGGKASLQPKRTPVTDKEIEAVMLGGCFE